MSTRRFPAFPGLAAALLLLVAIVPVVHAADPTVAPGPATEVNLGAEPLLPYIAALVVTSAVLIVVGIVAMQVNRRPSPGSRRPGRHAWWTCPACSMVNSADRETCFACEAARIPPTG